MVICYSSHRASRGRTVSSKVPSPLAMQTRAAPGTCHLLRARRVLNLGSEKEGHPQGPASLGRWGWRHSCASLCQSCVHPPWMDGPPIQHGSLIYEAQRGEARSLESHSEPGVWGGGGRLGPDLEPLSQWYPSRTPLLPNPFLPPPPCWVCPILLGLHLPQPLSEGGHHGSCVAA